VLPTFQPLWILKTVKEKNLQRLVHLSSDLARQVAVVLENFHTSQEVLFAMYTLANKLESIILLFKILLSTTGKRGFYILFQQN
jgi:hypothetical protein